MRAMRLTTVRRLKVNRKCGILMGYIDSCADQEIDLVALHYHLYDLVSRPLSQTDTVFVTLDKLCHLLQG